MDNTPQNKNKFKHHHLNDQEEEGFIEEKEELISYNSLSNQTNKQEKKINGNNSDEDNDYRSLKNKFSLHLPEANPLLDERKQIKYDDKQLMTQNINNFPQQNLNKLTKLFYDILKITKFRQYNHEQQTNSNRLMSNQIQPGSLQSKINQQEQRSQDNYLYDKYMRSYSQYKLVYSKYSENRQESEMNHNFAGYYINLVNKLSQRKQTTQQQEEEDINFQELKQKHRYCSMSPSQRSKNNSIDLSSSQNINEFNGQIDQVINDAYTQQQQNVQNKEQLIFDSNFESGNLMYAFQRNYINYQNEYDLIICNDINSKGYAQWFYFSISNTKKDQTIKLNLVNHSKKQSLFKNGMKPAIFSLKKNKDEQDQNWERGGYNIKYFQNNILKEETYNDFYYTLSFNYKFEYDDDIVYFAMSFPYSYTQMINHLDSVVEKSIRSSQNMYIKKETLCQTISNNPVTLLTITNKEREQINKQQQQQQQYPIHESKQKRVAIFMARQHPGETVSSFLMQGLIDYLVSDCVEANFLRNKYVFKIIPMVNPDGVKYGNFRCNLAGVDLNRQWNNPNKQLHPSVFYIKQLIMKLKFQDYQIDYFIDLHGHSKKLNSFIYACKMESDLYACSIFPMMLSKLNPILHYPSCTFGLESYKENTARGIAWNCGINKPNIFTIETSFFGYNNKQNEGKATHFLIQDLHKLGQDIIRSVFAYYVENSCDETIKQQLSLTLKAYVNVKKSTIIQDIIKMNSQNEGNNSNEKDDSGSDSDPEGDELTAKDQIENVIGVQMAKQIGINIDVNSSQTNNSNSNQSERSKQINPVKQAKTKFQSNNTQVKSKQLSQRLINTNQISQIEKGNSQLKNKNLMLNTLKYMNILSPHNKSSQCDCKENQHVCQNSTDLTAKNQNNIGNEHKIQNTNFTSKFRNLEKEQREQEIKKEKEEIFKRRFKIQKNTPATTPRSNNILVDPKNALKYKSSNIALFLRSESLTNSKYGTNNTGEQYQDKSSDDIKDQTNKETNDELNQDNPNLKNRFHAQNGLKGINSYRLNNVQSIDVDTSATAYQINTVLKNSINSDNIRQNQQIKNSKNGRLYSAFNRLATTNMTESDLIIQNKRAQLFEQINTKAISTTLNGFYTSRNKQKTDDQNTNAQQQQTVQQTTENNQKMNRSSSNFMRQKQSVEKSDLISKFCKILKDNSKKYNCDVKLLHIQRNTTTSSSCSTQRRNSNTEACQIKQTQPITTNKQIQGVTQINNERQNYQFKQKKSSQVDQFFNKLGIQNEFSSQSAIIQAKNDIQSLNQEQPISQFFAIQNRQQYQNITSKNKNINSNNNSYNSAQNIIQEPSTTTIKSIRNEIIANNYSRDSYYKKNTINDQNNIMLQNQQQDNLKEQQPQNKIQKLKPIVPYSKSDIKQIQYMNTQPNTYYDPTDSEIILNSWNSDIKNKKNNGIGQFNMLNDQQKTQIQQDQIKQQEYIIQNSFNQQEKTSKQFKNQEFQKRVQDNYAL